MFTIISTLLGFGSQLLPELFKFFGKRGDQKHELNMFRLRLAADEKESAHRMEAALAYAIAAEQTAIREPIPSFGVQMIDAAARQGWKLGLILPAFYLFAIIDALNNAVRSLITYAIAALYIGCKVAYFYTITGSGGNFLTAWANMWTEQDGIILGLVFGFWFGGVTAKAVFGRNKTMPGTAQ